MDIYFVSIQDLDNPIHIVNRDILYYPIPFHNDYYVCIYLKDLYKSIENYEPLLINDEDLINNYAGQNLIYNINNIIADGQTIMSPIFKIIYRIMILKKNWWCIYIEKRYIWNNFEYIGIITVLSKNKNSILDYFQKNLIFSIIKQPKKMNKKKHTENESNVNIKNYNRINIRKYESPNISVTNTKYTIKNPIIQRYFL